MAYSWPQMQDKDSWHRKGELVQLNMVAIGRRDFLWPNLEQRKKSLSLT
jgi:hypothetical protein